MPNPTAAILVIGDEILSGRTRDSNMHFLAGELTHRGIDLKEARVVADDHGLLDLGVIEDGRDVSGEMVGPIPSGVIWSR